MFLHDQELRQALLPAMSPVREENFGSVSYDLTIRGFVTSEKDGKESAACALGPGESVFASSEEVLTVPDDCVGFLSLALSVGDKKALKMRSLKEGKTIAAIIHEWIGEWKDEVVEYSRVPTGKPVGLSSNSPE